MSEICKGSGITEGLHLVLRDGIFVLEDTSVDGRFKEDVDAWMTSAGLNRGTTKRVRVVHAKKQNNEKKSSNADST